MDPRHLGMVRVTGELLLSAFFVTCAKDRWYQVEKGVPPDAKFVRMSIDESNGRSDLCVVYEHDSFPLVQPGHPIPTIDPWFSSLHVTIEDVQRWSLRDLQERNALDRAHIVGRA